MDHRDEFRASILDEPGDDSRRLSFADWLEQNGDPARAEWIRVQVEMAACFRSMRVSPVPDAYQKLTAPDT